MSAREDRVETLLRRLFEGTHMTTPGHEALNELRAEIAGLQAEMAREAEDAKRYRKLRGWMSSCVSEGWKEVEMLAAIACYTSWDDFDQALDGLSECNVGLMQRARQETPE